MRIAISGAGVAGPALAYWLERSGHHPVIIERAPAFRAGGYMIDFWGTGFTIAERMGILPKVLDAGYSVEEIRLVDSDGERISGFSTDVFRRITGGRFTSLPRGDLAALIFGQLETTECIFGSEVLAIDDGAKDMTVALSNGESREVDLLVGADGLHSKVRALAFGPEQEFEHLLGYHVAAFTVTEYRPRDDKVYMSYARPGHQLARFSMRDDRTMFLFVFSDEQLDSAQLPDDQACRGALQRIYGEAGWECRSAIDSMQRAEDFYFDRVSQIRMPRWSKGRTVLIGDAAACVSLLAGEGTGLAMTEAYVLAGELQRAAGDYATAFEHYETRLRPLLDAKQASAASFAGAFAPKTRLGLWTRNQGAKLLSVPPIAEFLVGGDLKDSIELPEYAL